MKNLLLFTEVKSWGKDEIIVFNNEKDLEEYFDSKNYTIIETNMENKTILFIDNYDNEIETKLEWVKYYN